MDAAPSLHPTDQILSSYGLGQLDDHSAEAVNEHLRECSDCRKRVAEMSVDRFPQKVSDAQKPSGETTAGELQAGGSLGDKASKTLTPSAPDELPPGLAAHPDYEIKRELGRGGMGVVYLAHNRMMLRDEVLKVMSQHLVELPGVLERFLREIQAVAKLRHPNIVTAYHATRFGKSVIFAMEYVEGLDLSRLVKAKGPLPVAQACLFIHQAALGLQHAHEEGLVHRDIKPENLILSRKGTKATIKILDFGLAKVVQKFEDELRLAAPALTSTGQAIGTPDYIAPEQIIDASTADIRVDIYSLGGTLYYLLAGRPPFRAKSLYDLYQAHISRIAVPLNIVRPEVPSELAALVAKMMAKDPSQRFQTPGEVAQALTPFFKKGTEASKSPEARVSPCGPADGRRPASGADLTANQFETDSEKEAPAVAPRRRPPKVWPLVALGVLVLGLFAAWPGGVFPVKTPEGALAPASSSSAKSPKAAVPPAPPVGPDEPPAPVPPTNSIITNSIGIKLSLIPAGAFVMGSPDSDKDAQAHEKPQHRVQITRPFYLGATEVTQGQYQAVTGANPSGFPGSDDLPVENVSWINAVEFCNALSAKEGLTPYYRIDGTGDTRTVTVPAPNGDGYRLPTEAEWEYACRAGSTTRYSFGDDAASLGKYAWYHDNPDSKTHPVAQKRPNTWGLYDMPGNVWEWCWDGYSTHYYGESPGADPVGPSDAPLRVIRGGCWNDDRGSCRPAIRPGFSPGDRCNAIGFRVATAQAGR